MPLKTHLLRSKGTLESLKSVFNVFWRKPSLGAPDNNNNNNIFYLNTVGVSLFILYNYKNT